MIHLGTSGFSYKDWVGPYYPEKLPAGQWLAYYAREFNTVELNVTYYRVPHERMVQGWIERTPPDFLFSVKAHRSLTHEREAPELEAFRQRVEQIQAAGKLACVLLQFPYAFRPTPENWDYLKALRQDLADLPVVVEFRQRAWIQEQTFATLREMEAGFCCVDEPRLPGLMPPVARVTGPVAYVRFHGRNAKKWWHHEHAWERYDYTYNEEELREWVPRIQELDRQAVRVMVYANNHYRAQSVDTIRKLQYLLALDE